MQRQSKTLKERLKCFMCFVTRKQKLLQMETIIEKLQKSNKKFLEILLFSQKTKKVIKSVHGLRSEEVLAIKFKDGQVKVKVLNN